MKREKLITEHMANVNLEICENLYNQKGATGVYDYGKKIKLDFTPCRQCEADTPQIKTFNTCVCAVCGTNKM